MTTYLKSIIHERWDSMPIKLREAMFSPAYGETLLNILENNHISEHKSETIIRLVGYVMMGLIHPDELDKEIKKELDINKNVIEEIAGQIDKKIFSHLREEIMNMYSPVLDRSGVKTSVEEEVASSVTEEESPSPEDKEKPKEEVETDHSEDSGELKSSDTKSYDEPKRENKLESKSEQIPPKKESVSVKTSINKQGPRELPKQKSITEESSEPKTVDAENSGELKEESPAPFVIHEESGFAQPQGNKEEQRKSFSFSLGKFFDEDHKEEGKKESPTAKIETSGMKQDKNKKRTVHYSEHTTPISSEESKSFINMDGFQSKPSNSEGSSIKNKIKDFPQKNSQNDKLKDTDAKASSESKKDNDGPTVKGNTIDLKNNN